MTTISQAITRTAKASDEYVNDILAAKKKMGGTTLTAAQRQAHLNTIMADKQSGFQRLGQAMIGPVQLKLRYQGLVRNVLMEDPLTPGVPIEYDVLDELGQAYMLHGTDGEVKITPFEGKRLPVRLFRIASFPVVRKEDLYELRVSVVEHAQEESRQAIQKQEDTRLILLLDAAIEGWAANNPKAAGGNTNKVTITGDSITPEALYEAAANVQEHELEATRLLLNPRDYYDFYRWDMNATGWAFKDRVVAGEKITQFGEFTIGKSTIIPKGTTYLTPAPEFLGVMPVRYSLDVEENNQVERFHRGWVMDEMIGMAILNPRGLVKITKQ